MIEENIHPSFTFRINCTPRPTAFSAPYRISDFLSLILLGARNESTGLGNFVSQLAIHELLINK
jgi:hypothetical protein